MPLFLSIDCSIRAPELCRLPGFHFDKNQGRTRACHDIDLGIRTRLVVSRYNGVAATPQIPMRQVLTPPTQGSFWGQRSPLPKVSRPVT